MSSQKEAGYFHFLGSEPDFEAMAARHGRQLHHESLRRYQRAKRLSVVSERDYKRLWKTSSEPFIRGEATPTYFFDPEVTQRIWAKYPSSKLILILRNPVHRAYSEYLQFLRLGLETHRMFEEALAAEPVAVEDYWWGARRYVRSSLYATHLNRFLSIFPRSQVKIYLFEQLKSDVVALMRDCFSFLEVRPDFQVDTSFRHKEGFVPENTGLVRFAQSDHPLKGLLRGTFPRALRGKVYDMILRAHQGEPPPLTSLLEAKLRSTFLSDLTQLESIARLDLRDWYE